MRTGRIATLVAKEILTVLRDKRSRMILIMPPLMQMLVFSFAATLEVDNVSIAVLNRDNGKASQEIVQRLRGSPTFTRILFPESGQELQRMIDGQNALVGLRMGDDFSARLLRGEPAVLQAVLDGRRSNAAQVVLGYVRSIAGDVGREHTQSRGPPVRVDVRHWFNPNLEYINHTLPGLVVILTTVIALVVTSLSVAREREMGTYDQLLVSPLTPLEILAGKVVPGLIIGIAEGTLILTAAVFLFGVPFRGALPALYAAMLVFVAAIIGVGLFISSISKTQQQAILGSFIFMSPAVLLSGFASPVENMPPWLQALNQGNPLSHFLVVVKGVMLKDMSWPIVLDNTWPLAVIAGVTLSAAGWFFGRNLE